MRVLLEMRAALEGYAGIPQESRLLFRGLSGVEGVEVQGLLQSAGRPLPAGLPVVNGQIKRMLTAHEEVDRLSRIVIALEQPLPRERLNRWHRAFNSLTSPLRLTTATLLGVRQGLSGFDPTHFRDFVWRSLFAKTLPPEDFEVVTNAILRVARLPYSSMHMFGVATRRFGRAIYPTMDTRDIDVLVAQTPFPARVSGRTRLVVRYMDAVPLFLPHTIIRKAFHQALHFNALHNNVRSGGWFACASEATRRDLLAVFPEAEPRTVTIHCMLSHHYHAGDHEPSRVSEIIAKRRDAASDSSEQGTLPSYAASAEAVPYLLMVSTIEPRKNHAALLSAWEYLRTKYPQLKLLIVGSLGWDHEPISARFKPWMDRGELFRLSNVPTEELRNLYQHALATVCPSVAEGFDYTGVEAMRCGGVVAASDIPVHREVFDRAAEYFSPYSVDELVGVIDRLIGADGEHRRRELVSEGAAVAARYLPERIVPRWRELLAQLQN